MNDNNDRSPVGNIGSKNNYHTFSHLINTPFQCAACSNLLLTHTCTHFPNHLMCKYKILSCSRRMKQKDASWCEPAFNYNHRSLIMIRAFKARTQIGCIYSAWSRWIGILPMNREKKLAKKSIRIHSSFLSIVIARLFLFVAQDNQKWDCIVANAPIRNATNGSKYHRENCECNMP